MNTRETILKNLDANIPREVISTRNQSGVELSYLESWYVIDRLNQVLGTDNWEWIVESLTPIQNADKVSFICHGKLIVSIGETRITKSGIGYGSDKSKFNQGEMATKEAESDALKRSAMKLGRSLGLALYDKTQEYVNDTVAKTVGKDFLANTDKNATAESRASVKSNGARADLDVRNTRPLKDIIKQAFEVLKAQKKIEAGDFKTKYLSGAGISTLSEDQALKTLTNLKTDFPELNL